RGGAGEHALAAPPEHAVPMAEQERHVEHPGAQLGVVLEGHPLPFGSHRASSRHSSPAANTPFQNWSMTMRSLGAWKRSSGRATPRYSTGASRMRPRASSGP